MIVKFGKPTLIAAAHGQSVNCLPLVSNSHPNCKNKFGKNGYCVDVLDTMNKLKQKNWNENLAIDKLPAIPSDLV